MKIDFEDPRIRYTGRWGKNEKAMTATAAGAYFELAFTGNMIRLDFDLTMNDLPRPDLYLSLDGGAHFEAPLASYLRVSAAGDGVHTLTVLFKSSMEMQHRWYHPLVGKVSFLGAEADGFCELSPDNRPTIEFVGDSITEGVLINPECTCGGIDQRNRPYQDDVTATYAALTAEALHLRPYFMGYGAVGVTKSGCGSVPDAASAYPYNFSGSPVTYPHPDYILINHGANDRRAGEVAYTNGYRRLLSVVTEQHPNARIFALSPFCGAYAQALSALVRDFASETGRDVHFIDSTGWIPAEPLHPNRDGHRAIASHLIPILKEYLK